MNPQFFHHKKGKKKQENLQIQNFDWMLQLQKIKTREITVVFHGDRRCMTIATAGPRGNKVFGKLGYLPIFPTIS
jgi:hypothetical protein